jgi:hypothetical protein
MQQIVTRMFHITVSSSFIVQNGPYKGCIAISIHVVNLCAQGMATLEYQTNTRIMNLVPIQLDIQRGERFMIILVFATPPSGIIEFELKICSNHSIESHPVILECSSLNKGYLGVFELIPRDTVAYSKNAIKHAYDIGLNFAEIIDMFKMNWQNTNISYLKSSILKLNANLERLGYPSYANGMNEDDFEIFQQSIEKLMEEFK